MKSVNINLVVQTNFWGKVSLAFVAVLVFTTFGITLANCYDYNANTKVIKTYESRIKKLKKRSEQKRISAQKILTNKKEYQQLKQELNYLSAVIKKNMFPLTMVLTEIERVKPDKIDINELIFSDSLKLVIIKGKSSHAGSVSGFLSGMDRSQRFNIELSREEIKEDNTIVFELTAKWISIGND